MFFWGGMAANRIRGLNAGRVLNPISTWRVRGWGLQLKALELGYQNMLMDLL